MVVKVAGRGPQVTGVAGLFLALSTIAVLLRCYCRVVVVKSFGLDDWMAVVAWVFFVFFCGFAITGAYHGTGQHVGTFPLEEVPIGLKWWWACEPVYVLSNMALKLSIGIFLLRIAVARTHRVIIWTIIAAVELYGAFYFFLFVLQCRPSAYFWTQYTGGKGSCINPKITVDATYGYSAISCLADWTLGIIPVFLVWNLQMNARTKLSVALILAVGAIASTATIVRFPYVKDLANQADFLYATTDVALWSTSETGIGITASCVATLRPLFRDFYAKSRLMGGSSSHGRNTNGWPSSHGPSKSNGYMRSRTKDGIEELALTSELRGPSAKQAGITTTIISDPTNNPDLERGAGGWNGSSGTVESTGPLGKNGGWGKGGGKLDASSDEEDLVWSQRRILKTTSSSQVVG